MVLGGLDVLHLDWLFTLRTFCIGKVLYRSCLMDLTEIEVGCIALYVCIDVRISHKYITDE